MNKEKQSLSKESHYKALELIREFEGVEPKLIKPCRKINEIFFNAWLKDCKRRVYARK